MLSQLRGTVKSPVALVFIGLLIVSFAIWGIADIFTGRTNTAVAKVGDTEIQADDYLQEFNRRVEVMSQRMQRPLTRSDALQFSLDSMVLQNMVERSALAQKAAAFGLTTPDSELKRITLETEAFEGLDGKFDYNMFRSVLRQNGLTQARYEEGVRTDTTLDQLFKLLEDGIKAPTGLAEQLYKYTHERRTVSYVVLGEPALGKIDDPSDEVLKTFFDENGSSYMAPEYRSFSYILLSPAEVAKSIEIADDKLREHYDFYKDKYSTPEKRIVQQIIIRNDEDLSRVKEMLTENKPFADIAKALELKDEQIALGEVTRDQILDPAVAEAAFGLEKPGMSDLVEGTFGHALANVTGIKPASVESFEDVKAGIKAEMALDQAGHVILERLDEIADAKGSGQTLEEAGASLNIPVGKFEDIDRTGRDRKGEQPPALRNEPTIINEVFKSEEGMDNDPAESSDSGYVIVEVAKVTLSRIRDFDDARGDALTDWKDQERDRIYRERGEELAGEVTNADTLTALAERYNVTVETPLEPLFRDRPNKTLSNALLEKTFAAKEGETVHGPAPDGKGYVIVRVGTIIEASEKDSLMPVGGLQRELQSSLSAEIVQQFIEQTRTDIGVRINRRNAAVAVGRSDAESLPVQ